MLFAFLILVEIASCLWCFIGRLESYDHSINNWIVLNGFSNKSNFDILIASLYFILSTFFTIGYGDIKPSCSLEKIFIIILMSIGTLVWTFLITGLSQVFSHSDERNIKMSQKKELFRQIISEYGLNKEICKKINVALSYDYNKNNLENLKLLESLPSRVKNEMYIKMYEKYIYNLKFFKNQSYDFIISVLPLLKFVHFLRGENIIKIGDTFEEIYIVCKGKLSLHLGTNYSNFEIGDIDCNYHFGDINMFLNDQSIYDVTVKSKKVDLLLLKKTDFANLKLNFSDAINKILKISQSLYCQIEYRKISAIEHYNKHKTFDNFTFKPLNNLLSNQKVGTNSSQVSIKNSDLSKLSTLKTRIEREELLTKTVRYNLAEIDKIRELYVEENSNNIYNNNKFKLKSDSNVSTISRADQFSISGSKSTVSTLASSTINKTIFRLYSPDLKSRLLRSNPFTLDRSSSKNENTEHNEEPKLIKLKTNNSAISLKENRDKLQNPAKLSFHRESRSYIKTSASPSEDEHSNQSEGKIISNKLNLKDKNIEPSSHSNDFIVKVGNMIENNAILHQNKEFVSDFVKEFVQHKLDEKIQFKNLLTKLYIIEKRIKTNYKFLK